MMYIRCVDALQPYLDVFRIKCREIHDAIQKSPVKSEVGRTDHGESKRDVLQKMPKMLKTAAKTRGGKSVSNPKPLVGFFRALVCSCAIM